MRLVSLRNVSTTGKQLLGVVLSVAAALQLPAVMKLVDPITAAHPHLKAALITLGFVAAALTDLQKAGLVHLLSGTTVSGDVIVTSPVETKP